MWMVTGILAIVTAIINVNLYSAGKEAKWFRYLSLSLTALTVCIFYSMAGKWVKAEDWSALMDVVPTMSIAVWIATIASILINGISLFPKKKK